MTQLLSGHMKLRSTSFVQLEDVAGRHPDMHTDMNEDVVGIRILHVAGH